MASDEPGAVQGTRLKSGLQLITQRIAETAMGKYLDLVRKPLASTTETSKDDQRYPQQDFGRFGRFGRTYTALEQRWRIAERS
jgi:hypothetical protein